MPNWSMALRVGALSTVLAVLSAAPVAAASPSLGNCKAITDLYSTDPATLHACGFTGYPLTGHTELADGGTASLYRVDGMDVRVLVPPAGFDVLRASASELAAYGIPARPNGASTTALEEWTQTVGRAQFQPGPPMMYMGDTKFDTSNNWSGYYASGASFTEAGAHWTEPSVQSGCSGATAGTWAGLGGMNSGNLAQNGTALLWPVGGVHQAWWEILPANPTFINFYADPGYGFEVMTSRYSGNFLFFFNNDRTGYATTISVASSRYDGSTAEVIVERGYPAPLANIGTESLQAYANNNYMSSYTHTSIVMKNGSNTLTQVSSMGSSGAFTDKYLRCS
jgi:hypothetical protein